MTPFDSITVARRDELASAEMAGWLLMIDDYGKCEFEWNL